MSKLAKNMAWSIPAAITIAYLFRLFGPIDGRIGHDYYHDFSRFWIGAAHFWQRGLTIPHFTANLCGGIPLFANPQSAFHSLPQVLTFFVDPLLAARLSLVAFFLAGYFGAYAFFRRVFFVPTALSHLGSLLWIQNGFLFANLFVGHLTHHSYLLLPWLLYFPFSLGKALDKRFWLTVAFSTLLLLYVFYSGGIHVLVIFCVAAVLAIPALEFHHRKNSTTRLLLLFCVTTFLLFSLGASGRALAAKNYSRLFAIGPIDSSGENFIVLALRYFWFLPGQTPLEKSFGRMAFGAWEYIGFLSKITLPGIVTFAVFSIRKKRYRETLIYLSLTLVILVLSAGTSLNSSLPFFSHYHNPIKLLAALSWFIILSTVLAASELMRGRKLSVISFCVGAGLLFFEFVYHSSFFTSNRLGIAYRYDPIQYRRNQGMTGAVSLPPVQIAAEGRGNDIIGAQRGATSLGCYEPALGYRLENLKTEVIPGPVALVRDGRFNLNHPGCLLDPEFYGCRPWDRIPFDQRSEFQEFTHGHTAPWPLPDWLRVHLLLNTVVVAVLLITVFTLLFFAPYQRKLP